MAGQSQWTIRNNPIEPKSRALWVQNCHASHSRFKPDTRLCLSISDYHPDTWNPAWSVSTILTGLTPDVITENAYCHGQNKLAFFRAHASKIFSTQLRSLELHAGEKPNPRLCGNVGLWEKTVCSQARGDLKKKFLQLSLKLCHWWQTVNILTLNRSLEFNLKSRTFNELFPELRKEAEDEVKLI